MKKQNVVFDFDGVINSYASGFCGDENIPDPPVSGIKEAIEDIRKQYNVVVVSTRCSRPSGEKAIRDYLEKYGIEVDDVVAVKPQARCYIDDRAIRFDGDASVLLDKINAMKPWHKEDKTK